MFYLHLLRTSIRSSITLRGAFLTETILMIGNNLIFFALWWIFFQNFNTIGGWQIDDMAMSMAMLSGAYGVTSICFGGLKNLAYTILSGDLDPFMIQPKNLLFHILGSKSRSKGWGHLCTTLILFLFAGHTSLPLILSLILLAATVLLSTGIIAHSLAFWLGPIDDISQKYLDSLYVFALYPTNIYSGPLQIAMFTLIPAGLIGYLPVQLLRTFSWPHFLIFLLAAALYLTLAIALFYRGLKRYESGNQFGFRL
jgi:ABC-2 type transport system permease protein